MVNSNTAISIAIAHFLFNFIGVLIFYPVPALREIPIRLASELGRLTLKYRLAGLLYLLVMFFFIPFSLIYINRDAVTVTELTYLRTENNQSSQYTVIAKTFDKLNLNNRTEFVREQNNPASQIYSVYRKNNLLIINNELFELNNPGFCRDGQDRDGKFEMCIRELIPSLALNPDLSVDSVFVFEKKYDRDGPLTTWSYISASANLMVKREQRNSNGTVMLNEELLKLQRK